MSDSRTDPARLGVAVEMLQQLVLDEESSVAIPELVELLEELGGGDLDAPRQRILAVLATANPDYTEILPDIFALQEATQDVTVDMPPDGQSVEWELNRELAILDSLDEHSRYVLADAVGRGGTASLVAVLSAADEPRVGQIVATVEGAYPVVTTMVAADESRVFFLLVRENPVDPATLAGELGISDGVEVTPLERSVLDRVLNRSRPAPAEERDLSLSLPVHLLERTRFLLSQLPSGVQSREFNATLQDLVSVDLSQLIDDLREEVETLAASQGKKVLVSFGAGERRVRREYAEAVRDVLRELLTNAVVHGVDVPAERQAVGRDSRGTVRIYSSLENDQFTLRVVDDGRGLDEQEAKRLIGKGDGSSGLSRVRRIISGEHGGTVTLKSSSRGATVSVILPWTHRSWRGQLFKRGIHSVVVPAVMVEAILEDATELMVNDVTGGRFIRFRGSLHVVMEPLPEGQPGTDTSVVPAVAVMLRVREAVVALAADDLPRSVQVVPRSDGSVDIPEAELEHVIVATSWMDLPEPGNVEQVIRK